MHEQLTFSIDSRLLRELGERLVGRPHIALAELIKNSYDADATQVVITVRKDRLEVVDNGHGMTLPEFRDRWMRIGTAHKEVEAVSRRLHRPLTGSKGVGRLAVQLLADHLQLVTTSSEPGGEPLRALVDWGKAVSAGLLTQATADVDTPAHAPEYPGGSAHGTRIILTGLQQQWTARALRDLAREIWPLRPPFATTGPSDEAKAFDVRLVTGRAAQEALFDEQMRAVLNLWTARLVGRMLDETTDPYAPDVVPVARPAPERRGVRPAGHDARTHEGEGGDEDEDEDEAEAEAEDALAADGSDAAADLVGAAPDDAPGRPRVVELLLEFADRTRETTRYRLEDCSLNQVGFEIRVFNLQNRQPSGVTVGEARAYLNRFGGVHVYDSGFHLPYYGPDTDWLHVEIDHSHRLSKSKLLPEELVRVGDTGSTKTLSPLQYLPTSSRLFGVVDVDTSAEQRAAAALGPAARREALSIQVTRDRLADTQGYRSLVQITRFALDLYAVREAQRAWARKAAGPGGGGSGGGGGRGTGDGDDRGGSDTGDPTGGPPTTRGLAQELQDVLEEHEQDLPQDVVGAIRDGVEEVVQAAERQVEAASARVGLLATLATVGITSLAQEHEAAKQHALLAALVGRVRSAPPSREAMDGIADDLEAWLERVRATRRMFSHMLDEETRTSRGRFRARALVDDVAGQLRPLVRGMTVATTGVPEDLRLATGGYAEWASILQNVLVNAASATLDSEVRRADVDGGADGRDMWLRVQDTGTGVDLADADRLFLPFERRQGISRERAALGLGGSGLGLTIVRTIADELGVVVRFERPDDRHKTAIVMRWRRDQ